LTADRSVTRNDSATFIEFLAKLEQAVEPAKKIQAFDMPGSQVAVAGALIATSIAGWLHQLTGLPDPGCGLLGWRVRDGAAVIVTLRHRLNRVPGRLIRHAGPPILRLSSVHSLLDEAHHVTRRFGSECAPAAAGDGNGVTWQLVQLRSRAGVG